MIGKVMNSLAFFVKTVLFNCRYGTFNTAAVVNFASKDK